jgi:hypothetical protein
MTKLGSHELPRLSRRNALASAGALGAAVALVNSPLVGTKPLPISTASAVPASGEPDGYQLTPHVRRYYQTAA